MAAAFADHASAQSALPEAFTPQLTDPNRAQRFGQPPDATARSQPSAIFSPPPSAGETGFDSTGSIRKRKRSEQKKPNVARLPPRPPPPISIESSPPPPPRTARAAPPQQAARASYADAFKPLDAGQRQRRPLPPVQDPYEPVGVHAGEFLLKPSIEITRGYDSNVTRVPGGQSSGFTMVAPEIQAKSEWSRHELRAALRGTYTTYDQVSSSNRPMLDAKVNGRLDVSRDTRIDGEGRFYLSTDYPGSPNISAGIARLPIYTTIGGTLGLTQTFNHFELAVKGSADRTTYRDSELTDGSSFSNHDRDFNQFGGSVRAAYEVFPGVKPFVEAGADTRIHDLAADRNGVQRDSRGITPKVGTTFEITRWLTGEVSLGYAMRNYKDPSLPELRGAVADGSLIWAATGLTTATFTASTRLDESVLPGVSGAIRRDLGAQVDHAFRRWLIGTLKFTYGFDSYVGLGRDDRRTSLGAAITYKLNREVSLKGEYRLDQLRSNVSGVDYIASVYLVGLKLQR